MRHEAKIIYCLLTAYLLLICCLMSCQPQAYTQQSVAQKDTVDIRLISVDSLSGMDMAIGQKLSIPDMDIEIVRVSEKEVLVRTPVRTETRTRTTFVPVKKVDKRRTNVRTVDKSRTRTRTEVDNSVRTDTDTDVRTTDKSRTRTRTKEVDKSRTGSGNKTRTKTVDKEVTRNGFPWWILILSAILGLTGYLAKKAGKLPFV